MLGVALVPQDLPRCYPVNGSRLLALWRDEPREEVDVSRRETRRGRIQEAARRLLNAAPQKQMMGATLAALTEWETGYAGDDLQWHCRHAKCQQRRATMRRIIHVGCVTAANR